MKHYMKLQDGPFKSIKNGTKTIEMRLNDEKRSKIKIDDTIEFTNIITSEKLDVLVTNLYYFDSFEDLYKKFEKKDLGYQEYETATYKDMEKYYSKEKQKEYGVVGIKIKLL